MSESIGSYEPSPEIQNNPETVVILLKPGGAEYEQRIIDMLKERNITINKRRIVGFDENIIDSFYDRRSTPDQLRQMVDYFEHAPTVVLEASGVNAIQTCMRLKGHIRGLFGLEEKPEDLIHTSDSIDEAEREWKVIIDPSSSHEGEDTSIDVQDKI